MDELFSVLYECDVGVLRQMMSGKRAVKLSQKQFEWACRAGWGRLLLLKHKYAAWQAIQKAMLASGLPACSFVGKASAGLDKLISKREMEAACGASPLYDERAMDTEIYLRLKRALFAELHAYLVASTGIDERAVYAALCGIVGYSPEGTFSVALPDDGIKGELYGSYGEFLSFPDTLGDDGEFCNTA